MRLPGFAFYLPALSVLVLGGCLMSEPAGTQYSCLPPEVIQTTPAPGETDVPLDTKITITFGTPLDSSSLDSSSLILVDGTDTVPGDLVYNPDDTSLTFTPEDSLIPEETYTVIVTTDFTDTLGTPLDTTYTWTFTTVDSASPPPDGIDEVFPTPGDEDVPLDPEITVTFDTLFDPGSFDTTSIILTLGPDTIPGTITYDPVESTLVFDPVDSLIPDTTYTVSLTFPTGDPGSPGGPLGPPGPPPDTTVVWTFTTVDSIPNAPVLKSINDGSAYNKSSHNGHPFADLYWFAGAGPTPTTYHLEVSTSPTFATLIYDAAGIPNNSFVMLKPVPDALFSVSQQYYWRVNASNSGGTGPWSPVWSFTVNP